MRKLSNFDDFRIRFITGLTRSSLFCFQLAAGAGSLAALGLWRVCEDAAIGRRRLSRSEDSDSALLGLSSTGVSVQSDWSGTVPKRVPRRNASMTRPGQLPIARCSEITQCQPPVPAACRKSCD